MNEGRSAGGFGPATLSYQDIQAWSMLSGIVPSPGETRMIFAIDRAYLTEMNRLRDAKSDAKAARPKPSPPPRRTR